MLLELLRRDWILNRTHLLLSFAIFGAFEIFAMMRIDSSRAFLVFACVYSSFLAVTIFIREDKFRAVGWTCSLPVSRRDLVLSRFVAAWGLVIFSLAVVIALAAMLPGSHVSISAVLDPSTLLIGAAVVTIVLALMQPMTIRFGFSGVLVFLVAAQVLGVVLLTVVALLRSRGVIAGGGIGAVIGAIPRGVAALHEAMAPLLFTTLAVATLLAINYAGYRLALGLFRRREF